MIFKSEQQTIPEVKPLLKKTVKKKPFSRKDRLMIIWIFLLTVFLSIGFYLKSEFPLFKQKITSPIIISNIRKEEKFDPLLVLSKIEALTKDLRGTYGVYVYRFKDKKDYGVHQEEIFPAASLMKLPVILTLYQEAESGKIDLETKYKLVQKDKLGGAGILQTKPVGSVYTYRQLAELMGKYSDNTANSVLLRILDSEKVQQTVDKLMMSKTSLKNYKTSPEDIGIFFRQLYEGEVVSKEHQEEILKFLTKTAFEDWIPAGLVSSIQVAHKIGRDTGTFSDGGIIFAQKPFVLVIMSKAAREYEAQEVLPKITRLIWEFESK